TYEMWLKPASFDTRGSVIHKAYGGEGSAAQETNGRLTFYQGESGSDANPAEAFLTNQALTLDEWTHVVVTRKGSTVRWYVNGELDSTHVATLTPATSTNPLLIGNGWSGGYNGAIDE